MKTTQPHPKPNNGLALWDKTGRDTAPAALAKITVPSVSNSYPRERLLQHFDQRGGCRLVWIAAPAGYGKTTAVASYLQARRRPTVWYQCDANDADIASFFHYICLARQRLAHPDRSGPPVFLPEYLSAVPTFTRNFFRSWFAALPPGTALVLDNWQDVPDCASLAEMLPVIAEQIPGDVTLFVISRNVPTTNMSRWAASELMACIGIEQLRLSHAETAAIAARHALERVQSVNVDELYGITQGWPVGVTLMLRHERSRELPQSAGLHGSSQVIFDYVAVEVFERLPAAVQQLLLKTACVEHIRTSAARHLAKNEGAAAILAGLAQQNIFTAYRVASDSYHYHPLFRCFLQNRLSTAVSAPEQREWLLAAARALAEEGAAESAIDLFIQAKSWDEAVVVLRAAAPLLVRQARLKTLLGWIEALPPQVLSSDGWTLYWQGVCQLTTAFMIARNTLERACTAFIAAGERLGQMLACAGILQHITYCYADYRPMLPWLAALGRLLEEAPFFPSTRVELQIRSSFMLALSQAMPQHPGLLRSVEQVTALVNSETELASRAEGVTALLHFFCRFGRTTQYGDLDVQVNDILGNPQLEPLNRLHLMWLHAYQLHHCGDPPRVLGILAEARALARHEGLAAEDTRMRVCELQAREVEYPTAAAIATFCELEPMMRTQPPIPLAHFLYVRAVFELGCGHVREALKYAEEAVPLIRASHWHIGEALALTGLADVYCALERFTDATRCVCECRAIIEGVEAPLVEFNIRLLEAEIARLTRSPEEFATVLAGALGLGRQHGYANGFHTGSQLLKKLLPHALQLGVEVSYCQWVIRKRNFKPPSAAISRWPWPVKIKAMGRLEVTVDGAPLSFGRKAQRKPLDLLKLLLTHADGVEITRLMDLMWPDSEADSARNALDLTLHRLRRMLKTTEAVLLTDGRILLSREVVWSDVFALESLIDTPISPQALPETFERLLELYRAPLLAAEDDTAMIAVARERLRSQFLRTAEDLAGKLAARGEWELLSSLCRRAIEKEPLEASLHRELIRARPYCGLTVELCRPVLRQQT